MRFFTVEWAEGALDDHAFDAVIADYDAHISGFDRTSSVWQFATTVSLNDAWLDKVVVAGREIRLTLLTGDMQVGYWRTEITYTGASIIGEDTLRCALRTRPSEVWYDEFSTQFTHGFLLAHPSGRAKAVGEFAIMFDGFGYTQTPLTVGRRVELTDRSVWN